MYGRVLCAIIGGIMNKNAVRPAEILLPAEDIDIKKWAVVACDQFITKPEYWQEAEEIAADSPSALNLILPEIYLSEAEMRIRKTNENMNAYMKKGYLREMPKGIILTERKLGKLTRHGLIVAVDLEAYEFDAAKKPMIRATEKTILERIPPRVRIRENAPIELPHILMLMDDKGDDIVSTIIGKKAELEKVYDSELMLGGGAIEGYFIPEGELLSSTMEKLNNLPLQDGMQFCVGDGNHSLATAKTIWNSLKDNLSEEEKEDHPARFALVELINIYDEGLLFEPIHRVLFGVSPEAFLEKLLHELKESGAVLTDKDSEENGVICIFGEEEKKLVFQNPTHPLVVSMLDPAIEKLKQEFEAIEYIHGTEELKKLSAKENTLGFFMPKLDKDSFFGLISECGVMPKKTFSLGEAEEKRYYLEGRRITK